MAKIVIISCGVIGSLIAYHLAQAGDTSDVSWSSAIRPTNSPPPAASASSTRYPKISACRSMGTRYMDRSLKPESECTTVASLGVMEIISFPVCLTRSEFGYIAPIRR